MKRHCRSIVGRLKGQCRSHRFGVAAVVMMVATAVHSVAEPVRAGMDSMVKTQFVNVSCSKKQELDTLKNSATESMSARDDIKERDTKRERERERECIGQTVKD